MARTRSQNYKQTQKSSATQTTSKRTSNRISSRSPQSSRHGRPSTDINRPVNASNLGDNAAIPPQIIIPAAPTDDPTETPVEQWLRKMISIPPHLPVHLSSIPDTGPNKQPALSLPWLVSLAIVGSHTRALQLREIHLHLMENFTYFRCQGIQASWAHSVRHLLSLQSRFLKVPNEGPLARKGRGHLWVPVVDLGLKRPRKRGPRSSKQGNKGKKGSATPQLEETDTEDEATTITSRTSSESHPEQHNLPVSPPGLTPHYGPVVHGSTTYHPSHANYHSYPVQVATGYYHPLPPAAYYGPYSIAGGQRPWFPGPLQVPSATTQNHPHRYAGGSCFGTHHHGHSSGGFIDPRELMSSTRRSSKGKSRAR